MKDSSTPTIPPNTDAPCCGPKAANAWLQCVTEWALAGNRVAQLALPQVINHYLAAIRTPLKREKPALGRGFLFSTPRVERGFLM